MGWLAGWDSKADLLRHLTTEALGKDNRILAQTVRGNVWYAVIERTYPEGAPAIEGSPEIKGPPGEEWRDRPAYLGQPAVPPGGTRRFILVCLLGVCGGTRAQGGTWGYKDMDEGCGPTEVSCPLSYLDMVPCPGGYATAWRERVRKHHAERARRLAFRKALKPGAVVYLPNGRPKGPFVVEKPREGKRTVYVSLGWNTYRLTPRSLAGAECFPDMAAFDAAHPEIAANV